MVSSTNNSGLESEPPKGALEVSRLAASYSKGTSIFGKFRRTVLEDISFTIAPGEIVWLTGQNGAGKTTLLRALIDPSFRTRGSVSVGGKSVLMGKIAYVPQTPSASLAPWNSVEAEIALPRRIHGTKRRHWQALKERLVHQYGLTVPNDRRIETLSGGQKVRVAMLRALAVDTPVLGIFDEPLEGLDADGRREILNAIVELAKQGVPVIITSHLLGDMSSIAHRRLHLAGNPVAISEVPMQVAEDEPSTNNTYDDILEKVEAGGKSLHYKDAIPFLVGIALGILAWQIVSTAVNKPGLLPGPASVIRSMWLLAFDKSLAPHLLTTLARAFGCYLIANIMAIPVGILLGYNQKIFSAVSSWLSIGRALPVFALVGPAIGILPNRPELQRLVLIFLTIFLLTIQSTSVSAALAPRRRVHCARVFGASHGFCLTRIMPFEAIAGIFGGLEVGLPLSMIVTLVVETFLIPEKGLGLYIFNHLMDSDLSLLFAHILWPAILAATGLALVRAMSRRFRYES